LKVGKNAAKRGFKPRVNSYLNDKIELRLWHGNCPIVHGTA
jgi:hypothetical protein